MNKILITGGAGYIGSMLTPQLLSNGYNVTVIDNFIYNQTSLLDYCYDQKLEVIRGDCRDRNLMSKLIRELDNESFILPLAAYTGAPICDKFPLEAKSANLDAIKLILELREEFKKENEIKIIFPTTNSGYGVGGKGDQGEHKFCTENTPLNPISLYGRLKVEAEKCVLESGNSISLRLATTMGVSPRMRLDLLVNDFVYRAINDRFLVLFEPHFKRNYVHILDVTKAFIHCLKNFDQMKEEPYNIGLSDANISKWELCQEIKKIVPDFYFVEAAIGEDPDKRNYIVSNEKIEKTGWKADYSLQDTIRELIKGYQIIKRNQFANI